jgi:hypothetical protein
MLYAGPLLGAVLCAIFFAIPARRAAPYWVVGVLTLIVVPYAAREFGLWLGGLL